MTRRIGTAWKAKAVVAALNAADPEDIAAQIAKGKVVLKVEGSDVELGPEFFDVKKALTLNGREVATVQCGDALLAIEL